MCVCMYTYIYRKRDRERHEFEQTLGDSVGHGILVCCSPWGYKESDMT